MRILLFGDLAQVPAVTRAPDDYIELIGQFHQSSVYSSFIKWELRTIMRQSPEEIEFINLLDEIRNYRDNQKLSENTMNILHQKFVPGKVDQIIDIIDDFVGGDDPNRMVITFTNNSTKIYNDLITTKRSRASNSVIHVLDAKFFVKETNAFLAREHERYQTAIQRQSAMNNLRYATIEEIKLFCGAMKKRIINSIIPFHLKVIPNGRVMLLLNIDVPSKLINGTRGTVVSYNPNLEMIEVKFDHQKHNENPIIIQRRKSVELQLTNGKMIYMYQFPLKAAWSVTAHKSQGQTLNRVAINIGEEAFAHGSFYVALSRVRSLEGIMLYGLEKWPENGPKFHVNHFIKAEQNENTENAFQ